MLNFLILFLVILWILEIFTGQLFDGYTHLLLIGFLVAFGVQYFTKKKIFH